MNEENKYLQELLAKASRNIGHVEPDKIKEYLLSNIFNIGGSNDVQTISMEQAVYDALNQIDLRRLGQVAGLKSRWKQLDTYLGGGWQKGKTIVLGGRPGGGKTMFTDILLDDFTDKSLNGDKVLVVFWNFEMHSYNQVLRIVSRRSEKPVNKLMSAYGVINSDEYNEAKLILETIKDKNILFVDIPTTASKIHQKMIELYHKYKGYHIVNAIDHSLLLAKDNEKNNQELVQNLTNTCLHLKKSIGCTNIILSQIKRDADNTDRAAEEYVPRISDLVWSSEMEQAADVIMFLHNPRKFNLETFQGLPTKDLLALIIGKNREGQSDVMIPMKVNMAINSIEEYSNGKLNLDFSI